MSYILLYVYFNIYFFNFYISISLHFFLFKKNKTETQVDWIQSVEPHNIVK